MSIPKISVGIISYNHAKFLPTTVESVLVQAYENFEILIVDDGSTDDSLAIAESYAAKHSNVRVFTHPGHVNKGISATCNLAVEKAQGDYINILGSDDAYYDYTLREQVNFLEAHPEKGMVCGIAQCINETGELLPRTVGEDIWSKPDCLDTMFWSNKVSAPTVMVRRECYEKVGLYAQELAYSDWEMWLRILLFSDWQIGFIDKPLAFYRVHSENVSLNNPLMVNYDRNLQVLLNLEQTSDKNETHIESSKYQLLKELTAVATLNIFYLSAEEGRISEAGRYLSKYLKRNPKDVLRPRRFVSIFYRMAQGMTRAMFPGKLYSSAQERR